MLELEGLEIPPGRPSEAWSGALDEGLDVDPGRGPVSLQSEATV